MKIKFQVSLKFVSESLKKLKKGKKKERKKEKKKKKESNNTFNICWGDIIVIS